ncbi:MAG TPA: rhodanese-like domain-containing protein [Flavobacterium sp.]|jgi:rhodanese-related sulfurtransferase
MDLTQDQWKSKLENDPDAIIMDVRTYEEVEEGMIPNAIHLDIYQGQDFIDGLNNLDKEKPYYVYCKAGGRSQQACHIMNEIGFSQTYNLEGGFMNWNGPIDYPK